MSESKKIRPLMGASMMSRSIALSLILSVVAVGGAIAAPNCTGMVQSQGCTCVTPITPGNPIGQLTGIDGSVLKTGSGYYTPVKASTPLNVGDGILVGRNGKATLTVGPGCQGRQLGAMTSVVVRAVAGCACVAMIDRDGAPLETQTSQPTPPAGALGAGVGTVGALVATTAAVGGVTLLLLQDQEESPASP